MSDARPSSDERIAALLVEAQAQLQRPRDPQAPREPDLDALSQCIDQALSHHRQAADARQQAGDAGQQAGGAERVEVLERELRFAMGLMALLFLTGVWGFWRGAMYEKPAASRPAAGGSASGPGKTPAFVPRVLPAPRPPRRPAARRARLSKQALMPRAVLAPSRLRRPLFRKRPRKPPPRRSGFAPPGHRAGQPLRPLAPRRRGDPGRRSQLKRRRRLRRLRMRRLRRLRRLRAKRRRARRARWLRQRGRLSLKRRRLRFGDPALPSEVPPQWCGKHLRYGPYYPCLKRRGRRCIKRSRRRKYGCLRIRRR